MKRRELLQTLLGAAGTAVTGVPVLAVERPPNFDASQELVKPDWKPEFLDQHQNETLIALCSLIIPATDTPGAKEALVNRFIDKELAVESEEVQRQFLASLAYIDGEGMRQYKSAFLHLPHEQQVAVLTFLAYPHSLSTWGEEVPAEEASEFAGHTHFEQLKQRIARVYYNSEIGMKELGWDGTFPHGDNVGCGEMKGHHETTPHNAGPTNVTNPRSQ
jgi:gluconate 2-dehydrogenase gamma chain